ncbi:hypothetical protein TCE0_041r14117 [Talaromyces pinophilus]|uniref:Carrier domain-containing protein n=1 Tax=Talaromyces pinophilus TaxID=128442 RepID=A0A6V8HHL4_TALPI|nr:hypothetical protein TCE0_041r14117 [Talaromyces pinophilus]
MTWVARIHVRIVIIYRYETYFLTQVEITIVTTSLVSITNHVGGFDKASWIMSAYLLGFVSFHPAVLDAAIHFPLIQISKGLSIPLDTYVPQEVYGLWMSAKAWKVPDTSVVITTTVDFSRPSALEASISVFNEEGTMLMSLERGLLASVSLNNEEKLGEEQPRLIYKMERLSLLSQLTPADLQVTCEPEPYQQSEMEKSWSDRLEAALISSAQHALYRLYSSGFDITSAPAHLQTFINVLQRNYGPNSDHRKEYLDQELAKCLEYSHSWGLYTQAGRFLEPLLRSEADPLDLLVSSEVADRSYALLFDNAADDRLFRFLKLASHENPGLRILEIGSGTGGLTGHVLSHLEQLEKRVGSMRFSRYVFTDISPAFFEAGKTKFARFGGRLEFQKLNIEKAIDTQGFALESFDLVLAGCVLHATSNIAESMGNVRKLLRQGGHFVNLEITQTNLARSLVGFGSLPGWWLSTEDWRQNGPLVSKETWDRVMKQTGFFCIEATWDDGEGGCIMITHATAESTSEPSEQLGFSNKRTLTIVVLDKFSELQQNIADRIYQWSGLGSRIITLGDVGAVEWKEDDVVLSLIELGEPLLVAPTSEVFENIRTMIKNTQNLLWVALPNPSTPPSSTGAVDPRFEAALGFLRTIRYEEPSKEIVTLSCCNRVTLSEANVVRFIKEILCKCFRPQNPSRENEFVIEKNALCADRLIYDTEQEEDRLGRIFPSLQPGQTLCNAPPTILSPGSPGMLNTLRLVETEVPVQMASQMVEIECRAWPVSFRDVLIALDRYGDQNDTSGMGWELAGVVSRVGPGVSEFKPGDRVCTGEVAGMRSHVQVKENMVFKIPDGMSFARSVAALNPLMTAHHSLVNVARLKRGETILIHAAAGSTGQMAVCIAQRIGAQVYATVGFDDKKKLLMEEFGIPESHIFYSRDTSFKLGILRETAGRGVDVVLNSLSGDKLKASWSCIAPFGRFIEIGKTDIGAGSSLPMSHFAKNATFSAVDLAHLGADDSDALRDLTRTAVDLLFHTNVGQYPKPVHLFPVAESEKAFRFIQSGKNTGRTIITLDPEDTVSKFMVKRAGWRFPKSATYIIVGGLGGIGRSLIHWMFERRARYFITPTRSGIKSKAVSSFVHSLERQGAVIITTPCDASSRDELAGLLDKHRDLPPIRGCINAAMSLHDSMYFNMTHEQWQKSLRSKIDSSWNLHQLLPANLDFFILLSSVSAVYGSPGQCNYAAACSVQDAIARHRIAVGRRAVSLNLALIRDAGAMVDHDDFKLSANTIRDAKKVFCRDILAVLDRYCDPMNLERWDNDVQILVGGVSPSDWKTAHLLPSHIQGRPFFAGFPAATEKDALSRRSANESALLFRRATSSSAKRSVVLEAIVHKLADALCVSKEELDDRNPLSAYGVDSLMAVELRNWFKKDFEAPVTVFDIMGRNSSISTVADLVVQTSK